MKVIHLISGGDSGGAKTHVLSLLQNLNKTITAQLVCFRDGPFAEEARAMGINLMDAGHYATENVVCGPLARQLAQRFPQLRVLGSQVHHEPYSEA